MKNIILALAVVASLDAGFVRAQGSASDPRRTPAVKIFHRYKDAVIYLTGPMVKGEKQAVEEFFELPQKYDISTLGTGFVIHESGYVLTNAHAVEKVISHFVTLADGEKYPAELLAVVRQHDMALLKIDAGGPLTAVKLARSGDLLIGEPIVVIGNPHGLLLTCTTGVVSAVDRATKPSGLPGITLQGLIQTDASINPGSSGGPWFNALGDVIAMTASKKDDSENIAFGIPVAAIRHFVPEMLDVERRNGFTSGLELNPHEPCQVAAVAANSPAAAAGIRTGDVIAKVGGEPVAGRLEFCFAMLARKANDTIKLKLLRGEKAEDVSLTLGVRPKLDGAAMLRQGYGLTAVPLDEAKAAATSLRVRRGVVISEVAKGSPWNYNKLDAPPMPGDVLARIDSIRPRDLDHVGLLLDRVKPGQTVNMVLLRRSGEVVTRVDLSVTAPK